MLYLSKKNIWDAMVFQDDDGLWHNYYLQFMGIVGHIVSSDRAHWETKPAIDFRVPGTWCERGECLTGSIFKWNGLWHYAVGSVVDNRPCYGFFTSSDLYHWELRDKEPVIESDGIIYDNHFTGIQGGLNVAFRDPYFRFDEEGNIHAYLCATKKGRSHRNTCAVVAHYISQDTIHWKALEPIADLGRYIRQAECPSVFELNGKWYCTFLDHGWGGLRWDNSGRTDTAGTYYMVSDNPDGPYAFTASPLLLGAGGDQQESWAGRIVMVNGEPYIYSHMTNPTGISSFKRIVQTEDSGLKCVYDYSLELLKKEVPRALSRVNPEQKTDIYVDLGEWDSTEKEITGEAEIMGTAAVLSRDENNFILTMKAGLRYGRAFGIAFRAHNFPGKNWLSLPGIPTPDQRRAIVIRFDYKNQKAEIVYLERADMEGYGIAQRNVVRGGEERLSESVSMTLEHGKEYEIRIVTRGPYTELYVGDDLMLSKSMRIDNRGDVELIAECGKAFFRSIEISAIEDLNVSEAIEPEYSFYTAKEGGN